MRAISGNLAHWQCANLFERHRVVTSELFVFGRDLSRSVRELPRRISKYSRELLSPDKLKKICGDV
jgi:hypothetical protein